MKNRRKKVRCLSLCIRYYRARTFRFYGVNHTSFIRRFIVLLAVHHKLKHTLLLYQFQNVILQRESIRHGWFIANYTSRCCKAFCKLLKPFFVYLCVSARENFWEMTLLHSIFWLPEIPILGKFYPSEKSFIFARPAGELIFCTFSISSSFVKKMQIRRNKWVCENRSKIKARSLRSQKGVWALQQSRNRSPFL